MSTDQTATTPAAPKYCSRRWSKPAKQRTDDEASRTSIDRLSQSQQSRLRRLHRTSVKQRGTPAAAVWDGDDESAAKIGSRRWSKPVQQCTVHGPRRTTIDRLSQSQQSRIRRLQQTFIKRPSRFLIRSQWGNPTAAFPDGENESRRWKGAMKDVLLGGRATDAIIDTGRLKGRKLTYWHGVKMRKESKDNLIHASVRMVAKKCRACIEIVEQKTREAAAYAKYRTEAAADLESPVVEASPEQLNLIFSLFHSVPEVADVDSIFKQQLFRELRIVHFAAGHTVFHQWEKETMIGVILHGSVQLESKHAGVLFQAGTCKIGEVIGSVSSHVGLMTARCAEATTLLCLDIDRFEAVTNDSGNAERITKKNILKNNPVFSTLTDEDLNTLETLFTTITLDDNQVLCKEGYRADHVYVVKVGFLRVLKAFLPENGRFRRRPPASRDSFSAASPRATSRVCSEAKNAGHIIADNSAAPAEGGVRLRHFDLGEIGPKDMLGENGILQQTDTPSFAPVTPDSTSNLPALAGIQEAEKLQLTEASTENSPGGDKGSTKDPVPPYDAEPAAAAGGGIASSAVRQRKAAYIVSAMASGGRVEVYVAKAHELKRIQTESFRYCWKTAERLHQARAQAWSAGALALQLRRQIEWEAIKRGIVSQI